MRHGFAARADKVITVCRAVKRGWRRVEPSPRTIADKKSKPHKMQTIIVIIVTYPRFNLVACGVDFFEVEYGKARM